VAPYFGIGSLGENHIRFLPEIGPQSAATPTVKCKTYAAVYKMKVMQHLSFSLLGPGYGFAPWAVHVRSVDEKLVEEQISLKVFRLFSLNIPLKLHIHELSSEG
jgi:hypothetical protein